MDSKSESSESNNKKGEEIIAEIKRLLGKIFLSKATLDRLEYDKLVEFYDNKYPTKTLRYFGTEVKMKTSIKRLGIHVCDYIHVTQSMREWVERKELIFDKPVNMENVWSHIWKVYAEFTKYTRYKKDIDLFGVNEQWLSNMSQFYITSGNRWVGDCENFALFCAGLIEASGVPRGLYRVTAGNTKLGGHATLTAYDPSKEMWVQLETTATMPSEISETNPIYINTVWFSFDGYKAFTNKRIEQVEVRDNA